MHATTCESDLKVLLKFPRWRWGQGLLYLPTWTSCPCSGDILALRPGACLSEQSEEDIDVTALGKRQPENVSNPMYESTTSAPPEPSCDPFTVSLPFYRGTGPVGVQGVMSCSKSQWTAPHQEKLTSRMCLGAISLKAVVVLQAE